MNLFESVTKTIFPGTPFYFVEKESKEGIKYFELSHENHPGMHQSQFGYVHGSDKTLKEREKTAAQKLLNDFCPEPDLYHAVIEKTQYMASSQKPIEHMNLMLLDKNTGLWLFQKKIFEKCFRDNKGVEALTYMIFMPNIQMNVAGYKTVGGAEGRILMTNRFDPIIFREDKQLIEISFVNQSINVKNYLGDENTVTLKNSSEAIAAFSQEHATYKDRLYLYYAKNNQTFL